MANRSADTLFQLIHSLEKAEKRAFKLYVKRNSSKEDLKIIQLFDALDKMSDYDENLILKKIPALKKQQLSNIKAHLYKQVLASLRLLKADDQLDIHLNEQLDYARILYHKGLYMQSLKILEKTKELALSLNQDGFLVQIISLEKKIETLHITRSMQDRADKLAQEAVEVHDKRKTITQLSNISLQLYSWYIRYGHARSEHEEEGVKEFFFQQLPDNAFALKGFYELMYLYQAYSWYAFIRQDFLMYYRYTQKWVDLFKAEPDMLRVEPAHFIKGMHHLLNAHFYLRNYQGYLQALSEFEQFNRTDIVQSSNNNRIQTFIYLYTSKLNEHFMLGTFADGLKLIPEIEKKLEEYSLYLDQHRILVMYYKIASLYFGAGDFDKSIDYLVKVINWKVDLRIDLQCYARMLHLMAHYELGNHELMEYLSKSVYRFMAKMENLTVVEEQIFHFIRLTFRSKPSELKMHFKSLLHKIKGLEKDRFETRAFAYLDIISWLESKIEGRTMASLIQEKYQQHKRHHSRVKSQRTAGVAVLSR